jgi:hypothetical protein
MSCEGWDKFLQLAKFSPVMAGRSATAEESVVGRIEKRHAIFAD